MLDLKITFHKTIGCFQGQTLKLRQLVFITFFLGDLTIPPFEVKRLYSFGYIDPQKDAEKTIQDGIIDYVFLLFFGQISFTFLNMLYYIVIIYYIYTYVYIWLSIHTML